MTDHHDHHDDGWDHPDDDPGYAEELLAPHEDLHAEHDDAPWWDDEPEPVHPDEPSWQPDGHPVDDVAEPAAADHLPDPVHDDGEPVFPPTVDVGPLPEPVDGFPWIDTGSLGPVAAADTAAGTPDPAELAGYAAAELPPAQDPWAVLAASDDPATAALARFWRPETDGGAIPGM
jgi:hypothetical protein